LHRKFAVSFGKTAFKSTYLQLKDKKKATRMSSL